MYEIDQNPGCYPTLAGLSPRSSRVSSGKCLHDIPINFVRLLREKHYLPHIVVVHVGAADLCGFKIDKLRHWIHAMLYLLKDTLNTPQFDLQAFKGFFMSLILPRHYWRFYWNQQEAHHDRSLLNKIIASTTIMCNMHIVAHENIKLGCRELFKHDTEDIDWLSLEGAQLFTMDFEKPIKPHVIVPV